MNDSDLEAQMKRVSVPERPAEYWEDFPARIRRQLRREPFGPPPRRTSYAPLIWAGHVAYAAAVVLVCLQYHPLQSAALAITQHEQAFHGQLARLDAGLHRLMLNTDGMGYLLADAN